MSDERRPDDLSDEALARVLARVATQQAPSAAFRERLEKALLGAGPSVPPAPVSVRRWRARRVGLAAISFAAGAALVLGLVMRRPVPVPTVVAADAPATLRARAGTT